MEYAADALKINLTADDVSYDIIRIGLDLSELDITASEKKRHTKKCGVLIDDNNGVK